MKSKIKIYKCMKLQQKLIFGMFCLCQAGKQNSDWDDFITIMHFYANKFFPLKCKQKTE